MIEDKSSATIEVKQIEIIPYGDGNNGGENTSEYFKERYGIKISDLGKNPIVWYNGIYIPEHLIENFELNTESFFPILKIYFKDETAEMINTAFAQDNTKISIMIDSRTKGSGGEMALRPIRMDFKLVDFSYMEDDNLYFIQGVPDVDGLFLQNIESYPEQTSYQCLQTLAQEMKLGFRSNVSDTSDSMNWLNMNMENYQFIKDTTNKSYKGDNSFFTSFIDYYYGLNFIDVEQALNESLDLQGILTLGDEGIGEADTQELSELYIISSKYYDTKYNNVYESYEILNKSTKVSLNNGYRTNIFYYDRTGNWEQKAGTFLKFNLETNTDGKGISLKSFPDDTSDNGFFHKNTKSVYLPPLDIDNTHVNYNFAHFLNEKNLEEIDKVTIKITMREPNFNLHKYQKIRTVVMNVNFGQKLVVNERLSGGWLIKAINFHYSNTSQLKQELIMIKRELTVDDFNF